MEMDKVTGEEGDGLLARQREGEGLDSRQLLFVSFKVEGYVRVRGDLRSVARDRPNAVVQG